MPDKVCIVYHDMITAYGHGLSCCMEALFKNQTNFREIKRFCCSSELPGIAACFPEELVSANDPEPAERAVMHLLNRMPWGRLLSDNRITVYFALTQGEISKLDNPEKIWTAQLLVQAVKKYFPQKFDCRIFSASCASGNIALARAAAEIASGKAEEILVIGCDVVSEFTHAGFSSVHAITPGRVCRPYDMAHDGLLLGDAAGVMLLMSEKKARQYNYPPIAEIAGFGITTDSYHAAAPDPEGLQMALAIKKALGGEPLDRVAGIIGHGTGTALNDNMEIAALSRVFPDGLPLASIKGGTGHILAASGLIQSSCAVGCLDQGAMFPQTSLQTPQAGAEKFVSDQIRPLSGDTILTLNAGFGGLNAAVAVRRY